MLFPIVLPSPFSPHSCQYGSSLQAYAYQNGPILPFNCIIWPSLCLSHRSSINDSFFTAHYFTLNPCLLFGMILYFYIHVYSTCRVCYLLFANGSVEKMWLSIELNRIELPILYCLSVRISYAVWTLWPFGFLARGQDVGSTRIGKYMAANELRRCSREDVFSLYLPLDPWLSTAGADWSFLCGWNSIWFGSSGTA